MKLILTHIQTSNAGGSATLRFELLLSSTKHILYKCGPPLLVGVTISYEPAMFPVYYCLDRIPRFVSISNTSLQLTVFCASERRRFTLEYAPVGTQKRSNARRSDWNVIVEAVRPMNIRFIGTFPHAQFAIRT